MIWIFAGIFIFAVLTSFLSGAVLLFHFKRFKMPFDPTAKKVVRGYIFASIFIAVLSLVFLVLAILL